MKKIKNNSLFSSDFQLIFDIFCLYLSIFSLKFSHTQDLPALQIQALPADEQKQLLPSASNNNDNGIVEKPPEQILFNLVKPKSHYEALKDSLRFTLKPLLRQEYIDYVRQRALSVKYEGIALLDWENVSNLNLANIYYYFKLRG